MATQKAHPVWIPEKGVYQIQYRKPDGSTGVRDSFAMVHRLKPEEQIKAMGGWAKSQNTLREAAISLLADILEFSGESCAAYKGACDPAKPLPKELANSFRDAEAAYFKQFLSDKHPAHQAFTRALPTINDKGEKLEVGGKLNMERQFQYYLTTVRQAPSYSNAKNVVLGFWGYCGQSPLAADGENLVPPEVMREYVNEVRTVAPPDNSLKARLYAIRKEVMADSKFPPDDDMPEVLATLRDLFGWAEGQEKAAAERRSKRPQKGQSVPALAADAIDKAQQSTGLKLIHPPAEEPKPEAKEVPAEEPAAE